MPRQTGSVTTMEMQHELESLPSVQVRVSPAVYRELRRIALKHEVTMREAFDLYLERIRMEYEEKLQDLENKYEKVKKERDKLKKELDELAESMEAFARELEQPAKRSGGKSGSSGKKTKRTGKAKR